MSCSKSAASWLLTTVVVVLGLSSQVEAQQRTDTKQLPEQLRAQIAALLQEKASRTPTQRKISSRLLYALRQSRGHRPAVGMPTLRTSAFIDDEGRTLVDIKVRVTNDLLDHLRALDGHIVNSFPPYDAIRAWIPLAAIEAVASHPAIRSIRPADRAFTRRVDVSEGDCTHATQRTRAGFGVDGTGVKVGVISDSVESLAVLCGTGDLPCNVTVLPGQAGIGSSEGTAMLEIVHDLAPGATLFFATGFSGQPGFAQNIRNLRAPPYGCDIIVDDIGYFAEPAFEDGIIAQAVNDVTASGALYFSAAGNDGNKNDGTSGLWEGDFASSGQELCYPDCVPIHRYAPGVTEDRITWDPPLVITLQWSDRFGSSGNDYDLFITDCNSNVLDASTSVQDGDDDPLEGIDSTEFNDSNNCLLITRYSGQSRFLRLFTHGGILQNSTAGAVWGHAAATNAYSVAAVDVASAGPGACPEFTGGPANPVEFYSSDGPRQMFYPSPVVRQVPTVAAADCVSTATPEFETFCGTSAAAPHAAAIAALLLERFPTLSAADAREALTETALDIEAVGRDRDAGFGILHAYDALQYFAGSCCYNIGETTTECEGNVTESDCLEKAPPQVYRRGVSCEESCPSCLANADCDDGVACTVDSCNEGTDSCEHLPNDAACDNGLYCDGAETCDTLLGCQAGTPPDCGDAVDCTDDACNEAADACDHIPDNAHCDDGEFCTGAEICDVLLGCTAGSDPCLGLICDDVDDVCKCSVPDDCDDGLYCNGVEQCIDDVCTPGTLIDCDDGIACTDDACNESTGACDNIAADANCDDGLYCNGAETCDPLLDCQTGTPVDCDDGVGCTDDSCNESTDTCDNIPGNANCDDGLYCNGSETCDRVAGCQPGTAPCDDGVACTDDACNESTGACDNIAADANCDDGLYCNGAETCDPLLDCQSGTPVDCDDGVGCTDDSCNESTDVCDHVANNADCSNGVFCDGAETCHATLGCQPGADPCPDAACDETNDRCIECITDADCNDGLYCTGVERCEGSICHDGIAPCNDGVACTDDVCDEGSKSCSHAANHDNCDNGKFCDGAERCDAVLGCQAGGDPCPEQECDESDDACICTTDAHCDDGLFCNGPETCADGSCQPGSPPCTAPEFCVEPNGMCFECTKAADCDDDDPCTFDWCPNGRCTHAINWECQDGDADDVRNADDHCPGTPFGETVDASGCSCSQTDADGDSVNDCIDLCDLTPNREPADAFGCSCSQRDEDGDGVTDCLDDCPNTPDGEEVNTAGCAHGELDDDHDGVRNALDLCANTPSGAFPNLDGCSASQFAEPEPPQPLDSDADGVTDDVDLCPSTPAGADVDEDGCTVEVPDGSGNNTNNARRLTGLCGSFGLLSLLMLPFGFFTLRRCKCRCATVP